MYTSFILLATAALSQAAPLPLPLAALRSSSLRERNLLGGLSNVLQPADPILNPVKGAVDPLTGALAPVTGAAAPLTGALSPVTDELDPVTSALEPVIGPLNAVTLQLGVQLDLLTPSALLCAHVEGEVVNTVYAMGCVCLGLDGGLLLQADVDVFAGADVDGIKAWAAAQVRLILSCAPLIAMGR